VEIPAEQTGNNTWASKLTLIDNWAFLDIGWQMPSATSEKSGR